jgi:uncharacterized protein (DUF952 family)
MAGPLCGLKRSVLSPVTPDAAQQSARFSGAAVGGAGGYITNQRAQRQQAQDEAAQLRQQNELLRLQLKNQQLRQQQQQ